MSGSVPKSGDNDLHPGKVGSKVSLNQAMESAELALLNGLSSLSHAIGGLDCVDQMLKITVFVASAPGFNLQPKVAYAASKPLQAVLGDRGNHARSAIGVAELPRNSCVEIELVAAAKKTH